MKTAFTIIAIFCCFIIYGQSPSSFNYQAVVRDGNGAIIINQPVGLRFTLQQGSIGGWASYSETFIKTTNTFGLVTVTIGTGSTSDNFNEINWADGPYFIETAIDFQGGSNYSVMGTSQLLSVPYALHAKSAESVINDQVDDLDADPENELQAFTVSVGGDTLFLTKGNYVIIPGISAVNYTIQGLLDDGYTPCEVYNEGIPLDSLYGKTYLGGLIFYIDTTDCSGLLAASSDQSNGAKWGCYGQDINGADGYVVGSGAQNTVDIQNGCADLNKATNYCVDLTVAGNSDWFLPSKNELNWMHINLKQRGLGAFENDVYWSSSEQDNNTAWTQNFTDGNQYSVNKGFGYLNVRAVRKF